MYNMISHFSDVSENLGANCNTQLTIMDKWFQAKLTANKLGRAY